MPALPRSLRQSGKRLRLDSSIVGLSRQSSTDWSNPNVFQDATAGRASRAAKAVQTAHQAGHLAPAGLESFDRDFATDPKRDLSGKTADSQGPARVLRSFYTWPTRP